jgi:murein DD-endopeptidase MepM/ murein hydrolase activator NlpD
VRQGPRRRFPCLLAARWKPRNDQGFGDPCSLRLGARANDGFRAYPTLRDDMRTITRSRSRGHRLAAAMAAGAALPLLVLSLTARADVTISEGVALPGTLTAPLPSLSVTSPLATVLATASSLLSAPTPTPITGLLSAPTPTPLPVIGGSTPTPTPTPTSSSGGTPTPTPTLLPTALPTLSPVPTVGGTTGGVTSGGPGGTPTGTGAGTGSPIGGVAAGDGSGPSDGQAVGGGLTAVDPITGATTAALTGAPSMFGSALGLLVAPSSVGVETPALRHFRLVTPAAATTPPSAPPSVGFFANPLAGIQLPSGILVSILVPSLLVALGLVLARRAVALRFRKLLDASAIPFGAAAALSLVLLVPKFAPSATADLTGGPAAVSTPAPSAAAASAEAPTGSAVWQQLLGIERTLTQLQAQLQASTTAAQTTVDDPALHPARNAAAVPPTSQQAVALQLENALQTEYAFYLSAVNHPEQQRALLTATQTVSTSIRDAVVYDLQAVETQIAQEAAIAAAQQSALAGTGPTPTTLRAPELGTITQGFGPTTFAMESPFTFNGVTYPHFHTGIDIAAPLDTPVAAAADGVVVIAGSSTDLQGNLIGYGNYVVIAHAGKMVTLYGHLDKLLVHAGQLVHAGDVIGLEGSTGNSTGPHLHFEVRVAGLLANPLQYVGTQIQ